MESGDETRSVGRSLALTWGVVFVLGCTPYTSWETKLENKRTGLSTKVNPIPSFDVILKEEAVILSQEIGTQSSQPCKIFMRVTCASTEILNM